VDDLLLSDLRAELADLRTWAEREGGPAAPLSRAETRLDSLSERATGLRDWLDALADPAWRDRFGDRVTDFKATVGDRDPPISWVNVQAALEEHRSVALEETG
jgi:hypothetical protein